jgi:DNA polymerase-3 subunit beta
MKLILLKSKLLDGLYIVERACSKSISLPVLNNILFSAEKNFLTLSATDLEIAIKKWNLAKIEREGKALLLPKPLISFISFLEEKPVEIERENSLVKIESGNYLTKIKSLNPEEFPIIPKISKLEFISIPGNIFSKSLKKVANFASPSSTRPEIAGIYLVFGRDFIKMVSTDSFRLGEKTVFLKRPTNFEKEKSLILPQRAAKEMINIFGDLEKEIKIFFSANQILVESEMEETPHPEIEFTSRLIEGEFPDYQAIVPKKFETEIFFPKEEFLRQIKMASIFCGKSNEIKLKIDCQKKLVEFLSENPELGSYKSQMKTEIKGKNLDIAFNYRFLAEGISQIETKEVIFSLTDEEGPAVLKPFKAEDFFYVLMPIKLS